jgi:pyruvate/2-oxoglutarate dehydrogenase complex dihydrolipoamide acyltransferase (E2) component
MDELSSIKGTGTGGRVRKQDVLAYVEQRKTTKPVEKQKQPAQVTEKKQPEYKATEIHPSEELTIMYNMPGVRVVPMDNLQAKMAEHMVRSVHTSPHVAAIAECDMSAVDKEKGNG